MSPLSVTVNSLETMHFGSQTECLIVSTNIQDYYDNMNSSLQPKFSKIKKYDGILSSTKSLRSICPSDNLYEINESLDPLRRKIRRQTTSMNKRLSNCFGRWIDKKTDHIDDLMTLKPFW